ncbi:MAG: hypothetical protein FWF99_00090 [Desulfovibrionaceae bacterium]|nr:hypothetical protein [Desulfovibrionaceae bacterium]
MEKVIVRKNGISRRINPDQVSKYTAAGYKVYTPKPKTQSGAQALPKAPAKGAAKVETE